ncbi:hypothetical protein HYPSUDRAFT_168049 [Hypholoma sublateritium FD-334 SS-4]|uniref:Extracellular membrane protein CFEM domain-containing protein n=1 Tax=Hypholoma sublateritium (strain FD-334 SS-4) TaxID=945553 RepID=A0A0D2PHP9_HYPSF|nr:hypothetical protein HYPSUDRAFT_168049 [Hypholoma sublateritium FD-334 SS-4]
MFIFQRLIFGIAFSVLFLLQYTSANAEGSTQCSDPPRGQCTFYADCLESRYHCGPTGYPLSYGQVYCAKFAAAESTLSAPGQTWMLDTMACLQQTLVPEATGARGAAQTCAALREKAFDSHAACYVDSGLCALGVGEWAKIVRIIGVKTLVGSWSAVGETTRAAAGCLGQYSRWLRYYF